MWPISSSKYSHYSNYKAFSSLQMKIGIGVCMKKEEKEKKKVRPALTIVPFTMFPTG